MYDIINNYQFPLFVEYIDKEVEPIYQVAFPENKLLYNDIQHRLHLCLKSQELLRRDLKHRSKVWRSTPAVVDADL